MDSISESPVEIENDRILETGAFKMCEEDVPIINKILEKNPTFAEMFFAALNAEKGIPITFSFFSFLLFHTNKSYFRL